MSSLRGGAGSFMGKIRDTSKAVIQSVQHSMANRDLDLHLVTERIAAMSFPAEGLESAMRNHLEDIANILETRHPNHYMVFNLTERNYSVQKFVTGLCSQPGWSTQKPTAFRIVLETIHLCLDFLRRDAKNVIGKLVTSSHEKISERVNMNEPLLTNSNHNFYILYLKNFPHNSRHRSFRPPL